MRRRLARLLLAARAPERGDAAPPAASGDTGSVGRLGLSDERLLELAAEHRFGSVAQCFRLAPPLELRWLAWWGSALADIGCAAGSRCRDEGLMADAARFHLAVALFDDVVDRAPDRTGELALALEPQRLRLKLERPTDPPARLRCAAPDLGLIVALFDKALEGIGRRLEREPPWRDEVATTLAAMYRSELALSDDFFAAKTLPFTLIGQLALRPEQALPRDFFARLATLLGLWDDWQDLLADGWARAPNAHLGARPNGRLRGLVRGLWLTLAGRIPTHEVSRRLAGALEATLDSARLLPPAARRKTETLLLQMLGVRLPPELTGHEPSARARLAS